MFSCAHLYPYPIPHTPAADPLRSLSPTIVGLWLFVVCVGDGVLLLLIMVVVMVVMALMCVVVCAAACVGFAAGFYCCCCSNGCG